VGGLAGESDELGGLAGGSDDPLASAAVADVLAELVLEVIRAVRQLLDLAEAVVGDPALRAELVRTGRGLAAAAVPPERIAGVIRSGSQALAAALPAEVRRELLAAVATIIAPPSRAAQVGDGPADPRPGGTDA
jgi:hypothetical protein